MPQYALQNFNVQYEPQNEEPIFLPTDAKTRAQNSCAVTAVCVGPGQIPRTSFLVLRFIYMFMIEIQLIKTC